MTLSSKTQHAIQAMLELALQDSQRLLPLAAISERQSISVSYLEQLFALLRRNGLASARRGPGGGYVLARPAAEITVADIIDAIGAADTTTKAARDSKSLDSDVLWDRLSTRIDDFLAGITLADLLQESTATGGGSETPSIHLISKTA